MSSQMKFIVIAREDRKEDNSLGRYTLATRRVFYSEEAALAYADSLGQSRDAVAIEVLCLVPETCDGWYCSVLAQSYAARHLQLDALHRGGS